MPTMRPCYLLSTLVLLLMMAVSTPSFAQSVGEPVLMASGTLDAGQEYLLPAQTNILLNMRLEVGGGSASDAIELVVRDGTTILLHRTILSGELSWMAVRFPERGTLLLRNTGSSALRYNLEGYKPANTPPNWSGLVLSKGEQQTLRLPVSEPGYYEVTLNFSEGSGRVMVGDKTGSSDTSASSMGNKSMLQVPLARGEHTFTIAHDPHHLRTIWQLSVALKRPILKPGIAAVSPEKFKPNQDVTLTVNGSGFETTTTADLIGPDGVAVPCQSLVADPTLMSITVPMNLQPGDYSLRLSNLFEQSSIHVRAFSVDPQVEQVRVKVYLPLSLF